MINQLCIIINGTSVVNQAGLDVGQEDTSDVDKYNASTVKKIMVLIMISANTMFILLMATI